MVSIFTIWELAPCALVGSSRPIPSWLWLKAMPLTRVVSLASPFAVIVVGKKTVAVPLVFRGERLDPPPPGDMMVKGETGMLLNLAISSMKLEPLPKGELARLAEVGSP